jgi:protein TonB
MRRSFTLFSIVTHGIVIAAALVAQVLGDGTLPVPRQPLQFTAERIMPVDVLPPQRPPRAASTREVPGVSRNAAPIVAPVNVSPETGFEGISEPVTGLVAGIQGPPGDVAGIGVTRAIPPPPPEPVAPVRLHSGMKAPVKTTDVAPAYPPIARTAKVQGVVILEAILDAQGRVESVRVLRSIPLLDQAAVDAVQQWRFTPALLNGAPVPVVMTVTVNFTLQDR